MIKVSRQSHDLGLTPDLTPLLDIIFIVMVFLMLTAAVKLESLEVDLPTTDTTVTSNVENQSITVNILPTEPHWAIDGNQYSSWDAFSQAVIEKQKSSQKPIVIGAEKTADVQHLVKLLAFLQENRIEATQLLIQDPQQ